MSRKPPKLITDPIIEGASYRRTNPLGGGVITGTILGTVVDDRTGWTRGLLYTFAKGPLPDRVMENDPSFENWELIAVPGTTAATKARTRHREVSNEERQRCGMEPIT